MVKRAGKRGKKESKDYLLLNGNKVFVIFIMWIFSVIFHNATYRWFGIEEPIFFILAVIAIPVYLLISIIYTLIKEVRHYDK
ncbi:MAG: hypothetical protein KKA64_03240 [Nanoarchaeota archaeon]|nr:hypothetical protein [Nanoarchaeota archaeon]